MGSTSDSGEIIELVRRQERGEEHALEERCQSSRDEQEGEESERLRGTVTSPQ